MNNELLLKLLADRSRVVVPGFGAFIKKGDAGAEAVVFSPFLKKDDGILIEEVSVESGVDPQQARGMVEEFVAEMNSALAGQGSYVIKGIGELRTSENGTVSLVVEEVIRPSAPVSGMQAVQQEPVQAAPQPQPVTPQRPIPPGVQEGYIPRPQPRPLAGQPAGPQNPQSGSRPIPRPAPVPRPQQGAPRPTPQPRPLGHPAGPGGPGQNRPPQPGQRPPGTPPPAGYQQGQRPAGPGRPAPTRGNRPPARKGPPKKRPQNVNVKIKTDIWLIVAIIAAVLAILLIIYGMWVTSAPMEIDLSDIEPMALPMDSTQ